MDEEKPSLGALRSAIERKGAKWRPSIPSMSQITATERKTRLGLQPTRIQLQLITICFEAFKVAPVGIILDLDQIINPLLNFLELL